MIKNLIVFGILFSFIISFFACRKDEGIKPYSGSFTHNDSFPPSNADYFVGTYKGYYYSYHISSNPITVDSTPREIIFYRKAFDSNSNCIYSGAISYFESSLGNYSGGVYRQKNDLTFDNSGTAKLSIFIYGAQGTVGFDEFIGKKVK